MEHSAIAGFAYGLRDWSSDDGLVENSIDSATDFLFFSPVVRVCLFFAEFTAQAGSLASAEVPTLARKIFDRFIWA